MMAAICSKQVYYHSSDTTELIINTVDSFMWNEKISQGVIRSLPRSNELQPRQKDSSVLNIYMGGAMPQKSLRRMASLILLKL